MKDTDARENDIPPTFEVRALAQHVDPRCGTEYPGNTVIGPQLPWGSINPSPDTTGDARTDGYTTDGEIWGFSQLHVSGTGGLGRYGNFLVTPQIGLDTTKPSFGKSDEVVKAGYYGVTLANGIRAEIAPSYHSAIYKFTFPESSDAHVLIDISHYLPHAVAGHDVAGVTGGEVSVDREGKRIAGWGTYAGGWSGMWHAWPEVKVCFHAEFSKAPSGAGTWGGGTVSERHARAGAYFSFDTAAGDVVYMKIGVSMVSVDNAERFLAREIPAFDFDAVQAQATEAWNQVLSSVLIDDPGAGEDDLTTFYTNLYHAMLMPRDRSGDNPHWDTPEPYWDDHYTAWDTFRTVFPLLALLKESVVRDNVRSFIDRWENAPAAERPPHGYPEQYVTDAYIAGTLCGPQGGDSVDTIIADAYVKGVSGVDWAKAYRVLKYHADHARHNAHYRAHGWVNADADTDFPISCSRTLEFNDNDAGVALVARGLGHTADFDVYRSRSDGWVNLWNADVCDDGYCGFVYPRNSDGSWAEYDLNCRIRWRGSFYEGTSWQYSYYVPHNVSRLIQLMGGREPFVSRLEHYFDSGKHAWDNEPTFLVPWLFNYALRPDLTSKYVRDGMTEWTRDNLPGNDDSGAMGSWYVFAALGFFPVAGRPLYLIHGPRFARVTLQMENGHRVVIQANNASGTNMYVQSAALNDRPLDRNWFLHDEIAQGAELVFDMGPQPSAWGCETAPPHLLNKLFP